MKKSLVGFLVGLIVSGLGIGVFALVNKDDDGDSASSTTTTTASTVAFGDTTTTAPGVTTTTAAASTTTTAAKASTTTTAKATTTTGVVAACGSGRASVSFAAKDPVNDALSSSFTPQVTIDNQVNQPIEVEEVSIEVTYPANEVRTVRFTTAGTVIGPGTSASFTSDKLTSAQRYQAVKFTRFTYFTAGLKANCLVTTP